MNKEDIENIMNKLEEISNKDYRTFEVALLLFLRSDKYILDSINSDSLEDLDKYLCMSDYLICDDVREYVDSIVCGYEL